jgi:predicted permease
MEFWRDFTLALRLMRARKGWTAVALLSLAIGIGANTAVFSVAHTLLLASLPVPKPAELVAFHSVGHEANDIVTASSTYGYSAPDKQGAVLASFTFGAFQQFRAVNTTLAGLAAFAETPQLSVVTDAAAEFASGEYVSGGYFSMLRVPAMLGRTIAEIDDEPAAEAAAVISHAYWTRRFGMDGAVVGRRIVINGASFIIIGVLPADFANTSRIGQTARDVYLPLALEPRVAGARTRMNRPWTWWLLVMGRLQPGVTAETVRQNFTPVFEQTTRDQWESYRRAQPSARPTATNKLKLRIVPAARGVYDANPVDTASLPLLTALFAALLLIVCVNLANLLLSRFAERRREIAVRLAIGATRARLIQQWVTESLALSLGGTLLGFPVAFLCLALFRLNPSFEGARLDLASTIFAAAAAALTAAAFSLLPAISAGRSATLRSEGRGVSRSKWLSQSLVVVQVAASLVLLIGGGLLLRTLLNLRDIPFGFNTTNILLVSLNPSLSAGAAADPRFNDRIVERLAAIPGVESVAFSILPQIGGGRNRSSNWIVRDTGGRQAIAAVNRMMVSANFFQTMDIAIKAGRSLERSDETRAPVTLVNESFVKTYLRTSNPLGSLVGTADELMEIVGVVADARYGAPRDDNQPTVYMPFRGPISGARTFEVKTADRPQLFLAAVRDTVRSVDATVPLANFSTQREAIDRYAGRERMFAAALLSAGGLALSISMIGLFGVMSCSVAARTKEIGIRMAVGAHRRTIVRAVLFESFRLIAAGVLIGVGGSLVAGRYLQSLLFDVTPGDPLSIAAVMLLMSGAGAIAAYLPARRAANVDPLIALRND